MENGRFIPLFLRIREPPSLSLIQNVALCSLFLSQCPSLDFWGQVEKKWRKIRNLLPIWWYFEFQSFLILMLLSIFHSPQITAPCILSKFYSFNQWEILPFSELEWGLLVFSTFIATFQMYMT